MDQENPLRSAAAALLVPKNATAAIVATTRKKGARRTFPMSHNCNITPNSRFAATPVAALASGPPETRRVAPQACSFKFTKGYSVPHL